MSQDLELVNGMRIMKQHYKILARVASSEEERLELTREADDYKHLEEIYGGKY